VINLAYDDSGKGEPVLFIAGRGGLGRTWHLQQVPAFLAAGYLITSFQAPALTVRFGRQVIAVGAMWTPPLARVA